MPGRRNNPVRGFQETGLPLSGGTLSGNLALPAAGTLSWTGRGILSSPADGVVLMTDTAGTAFTRLDFGGTTASYPAIVRSTTSLQFKLADNSAFTNCQATYFATASNSNLWDNAGGELYNSGQITWSSGASGGASQDTGLKRAAVGVVAATNGSSGNGDIRLLPSVLTAGTMTATNSALARVGFHRYDWTNAMVVALGAGLTGDITVATLPAKTVVLNAYAVITGTAAGVTTLTVAVGRTSAGYIDYIVASDAKVAANTVYGDGSAERGTNLTGYDLPSFTGTTDVKAHFISTGANLDQTTGSTGSVYLVTATLP